MSFSRREPPDTVRHHLDIRVAYADTDQMGRVYHGNYLVWFERGRTEFLRANGLTYADLEKEGVYLPVLETFCKHKQSARYDDIVTVTTWVPEKPRAVLTFEYEITRKDDILAFGYTKHTFINQEAKPVKPPKKVLETMGGLVERRTTAC